MSETETTAKENPSARRLTAEEWRSIIQAAPLFFDVASWSMRPTINKGDQVLIRPLEPGEPRPGQVLAYFRGMLVTHRYLGNGICRGDNAIECDPPIVREDMAGIVVSLKRNEIIVPLSHRMPLRTHVHRALLHARRLWRAMRCEACGQK